VRNLFKLNPNDIKLVDRLFITYFRPSLMGTETENIELGIELGSECKESKSSTEKLSTKIPSPVATLCKKSPPMATLKLKSSGIPEISYSRLRFLHEIFN